MTRILIYIIASIFIIIPAGGQQAPQDPPTPIEVEKKQIEEAKAVDLVKDSYGAINSQLNKLINNKPAPKKKSTPVKKNPVTLTRIIYRDTCYPTIITIPQPVIIIDTLEVIPAPKKRSWIGSLFKRKRTTDIPGTLKVWDEDVTLERALQLADSIHRIEVDSLKQVIYNLSK